MKKVNIPVKIKSRVSTDRLSNNSVLEMGENILIGKKKHQQVSAE